ncbi:MAG: hypothetical protein R2681_12200 [Pyrinomonadaceae bacterium]
MNSLDFQCPSCKQVLQFSDGDSFFQDCRYCKGKIIVPSSTVHLMELEIENESGTSLRKQKILESQPRPTPEDISELQEYLLREQADEVTERPVPIDRPRGLAKPKEAPRSQLIKLIFYIIFAIVLYYWFTG